MTHDWKMILRLVADRPEQPTAAVLDTRPVQGSIESGPRSGDDGHKKGKGAKVHLAVDTRGHLLAAHVSAANENERAHIAQWLADVQAATGESVQVAYDYERLSTRWQACTSSLSPCSCSPVCSAATPGRALENTGHRLGGEYHFGAVWTVKCSGISLHPLFPSCDKPLEIRCVTSMAQRSQRSAT